MEKARAAYLKSIQAAPDYAPVYRQLGLISLKQQQLTEAKDYFTRYLQILPAAQDKAFIEGYLQHITLKEKP
jgi:tetratricopeptide (TPR) repeat protein